MAREQTIRSKQLSRDRAADDGEALYPRAIHRPSIVKPASVALAKAGQGQAKRAALRCSASLGCYGPRKRFCILRAIGRHRVVEIFGLSFLMCGREEALQFNHLGV